MPKHLLKFTALALILGGVALFARRSPEAPSLASVARPEPTARKASHISPQEAVLPEAEVPQVTKISKVVSKPKVTPSVPDRMEIPTADELRAEVGANPHSTPMSMVAFSRELGSGLRSAYRSDVAARELLSKVSLCVKGNTTASIQAICLIVARELAKHRKEYAPAYKNLVATASKTSVERARWVPKGSSQ